MVKLVKICKFHTVHIPAVAYTFNGTIWHFNANPSFYIRFYGQIRNCMARICHLHIYHFNFFLQTRCEFLANQNLYSEKILCRKYVKLIADELPSL